jgi:hypothetical protein
MIKQKNVLGAVAAIVASLAPQLALAESDVNNAGGAGATATARLDFQITIPKVLFLQVGTGTVQKDNSTVDLIDFSVPAANLGDDTDVSATAGSGDLGNGAVRVRVMGNGGDVQLTATTSGALSNGTESIPWSEIKVASTAPGAPATGYSAAVIPHPAIPSTGTGAPSTVSSTKGVIRQEGVWTYTYDNAGVYAAGTYGGVNKNNGRVVYTATLP